MCLDRRKNLVNFGITAARLAARPNRKKENEMKWERKEKRTKRKENEKKRERKEKRTKRKTRITNKDPRITN